MDVACQFYAIGRHPQAGEFVLSPGLLIEARPAGEPLDLGLQGRTKVTAAELHAARYLKL